MDKQTNETILIVILLILLTTIGFLGGFLLSNSLYSNSNSKESHSTILGIWTQQTNGERTIGIKTNGLSVDEIILVARHEICHEIYARTNIVLEHDNSERFAEDCEDRFDFYVNRYNTKDFDFVKAGGAE
jgi:hypothetical protein